VLPNFVVIGAMKGGTSSLAHYLKAHPDVFMATPKEPKFFTRHWERGPGWYEDLFAGAGGATAIGEASTDLSMAPDIPGIPERMHSLVPDARLVYAVRNPVERTRSHYEYRALPRGETIAETLPIADALRAFPRYIDASLYAFQLEQFLELYPRDRVLVISSDRLRNDRRATIRTVYEFLGVDPGFDSPAFDEELRRVEVLRAQGGWKQRRSFRRRPSAPVDVDSTLTEEVEAWLWSQFDPDLARLRAIVGPDFDLWGRA
jgi:hypothetical protein